MREQVLPALGPLTAPCASSDAHACGDGAPASCWCWSVDDTGFPKRGKHSVGVARQYGGELGKQDNCQVAVSLSVANERASLPIAYRLYLPEAGAGHPERRREAGVPEPVVFQSKPAIALEQIRTALVPGVSPGVVLADAGHGGDMAFQEGLLALGLLHIVGLQPNTAVWPPGMAPLPAKPWSGRGRPPARLRREAGQAPVAAEGLARSVPVAAWRNVTWREGSRGELASRFAALRGRPGQRGYARSGPWPELWLLAEWPAGADELTKYWLSNLDATASLARLVGLAKPRWRSERDYQELKHELGLGHFEGRGWRGFHHHASLCIGAYGFLVLGRARFSPAGAPAGGCAAPALPKGFRPRGARAAPPAARAACDRQPAPPPRRAARPSARSRPVLRATPGPRLGRAIVMTR